MGKIYAVFFADQKLPSTRLMTSLGLYFDRVTMPLSRLEEGSDAEEVIERFPQLEKRFLANNTRFLGRFGDLSPGLFRFPNPLPQSMTQTEMESDVLSYLAKMQTELLSRLAKSEFPDTSLGTPILLPVMQNAFTWGHYYGFVDSSIDTGAHLVAIPLAERDSIMPIYRAGNDKRLADILSSWLAVEAIQICLPDLEAVHPLEILEARENLAAELLAFRAAMYHLAKELRQLLQESRSIEAIRAEAAFIVKTTVMPAVMTLREKLRRERRSMARRIVVRALDTFKLGIKYWLAPNPMNAAQLASEAAKGVINFREYCDGLAQMENEAAISYLARLPGEVQRKPKEI